MHRTLTTAIAAYALGTMGVAAAPVLIDDFSTGDFAISGLSTGGSQSETRTILPPSSFLTREATLDQTTAIDGVTGSNFIGAFGTGVSSLSNDVGASSVGTLAYTAPGSDPVADIVDLTDSGTNNAFSLFLDLEVGDTNSFDLSIEVIEGSGTRTSFMRNFSGDFLGDLVIPFSRFGGADLADVRQLRVSFASGTRADLTFDNFGTTKIPVPAALPMMLAGLAGLGIVSYRRRKAEDA